MFNFNVNFIGENVFLLNFIFNVKILKVFWVLKTIFTVKSFSHNVCVLKSHFSGVFHPYSYSYSHLNLIFTFTIPIALIFTFFLNFFSHLYFIFFGFYSIFLFYKNITNLSNFVTIFNGLVFYP